MNRKAFAWMVAGMVLVPAACSDDDDDTAQAESILDEASPSDEETTGTTGQDAAPDDQDNSGREVIGTARAQLRANSIDPRMVPLRIDILNLERNGDLIELEMLLTNEGQAIGDDPPEFQPWDAFIDESGGASTRDDLSGVGLVDQGEQKIYLPVFDSEDQCLCTSDLANVDVRPGESVSLNATFGGVPDDVDTLDLHVPKFPAITGLGVRG